MTRQRSTLPRVSIDGKFFRLGDARFPVKGVSYGPFAPGGSGVPFASPEQTAKDFGLIRSLGANVVRVYDVPPRWLLNLADEHQLKVMVGIPWNHHLCFLDSAEEKQRARDAVRKAVSACSPHPALFAYCLANEIAPDIVRWSGAKAVESFLDELAVVARKVDPACLCTFASYPPTEFLRPQGVDFICFNVYLHDPQVFRNYLGRLQMIADSKPLVLGEFGVDSVREGEQSQKEILGRSIELAFRAGLAGTVVFSFTDDWHREGRPVEGWKMGLTTHDREPRPAFDAVRRAFDQAPRFPLPRAPKVSVIVASYNAARTLSACLDSLECLQYPDYEIILVDDGSRDGTQKIVRARSGEDETRFPHLRYIRHDQNAGLSVARNTGLTVATGEIIAFTDADCRADEDWLYYLVSELAQGQFAAMGGPNYLPPEDSTMAAAVMASPGGPAHVMLDNREAEHIPGCNMAFYKEVLEALGGFDPTFTKAGDDVDICWRLTQAGYRIGFSPSAFVWHSRRSTPLAYLNQQKGYGQAEALLVRKHPEYFNRLGGSLWRGRIYASSKLGVLLQRSIIYRGIFGSGWFQTLYAAEPSGVLMLCTSLEYHVLMVLPLIILSTIWGGLLPVAVTAVLLPLVLCTLAGAQAEIPLTKKRWWSRLLVTILFLLQPVVRGWARYRGRFTLPARRGVQPSLDSLALRGSALSLNEVGYWSEQPVERVDLVTDLICRLDDRGWPNRSDIGWSEFDVELYGSRWTRVQLTTASEIHPDNRRLIRFRLRPRWSMQSHITFWLLAGAALLFIGLSPQWHPWTWLSLLALAPFGWLLHRAQRDLQSKVRAFLDETARERAFIRVEASPVPASKPPPPNDQTTTADEPPGNTGAKKAQADPTRSRTGERAVQA